MTENAPGASKEQSPPATFPEPSLKTFISGVAGQALISLGAFENPLTGKIEQNLEHAKYSIDLLQILKDKMKGNLSEEEDKFFDAILFDLRMRFVEACR